MNFGNQGDKMSGRKINYHEQMSQLFGDCLSSLNYNFSYLEIDIIKVRRFINHIADRNCPNINIKHCFYI